ncbi:MAG TPA: insulinase family protein, partial [Bacteroidales bacterium]|nr:insulinase family protein [Bacteroidales bacterium]
LLPQLDEKQMRNIVGGALGSRQSEDENVSTQQMAMQFYTIYGENSPFVKRISNSELQALTISDLTGAFIEATNYEASIHYVGKKKFDEVQDVLTNNLALPANLKKSTSPYIRPVAESKDVIYFLNNKEVRQSMISLYTEGWTYSLSDESVKDAFNQYFSGGFNGIVKQELREKRSFAYSAGASFLSPPIIGEQAFLAGLIRTQSDKTIDAISEFVKLINEMPDKPERMESIKKYLVQSAQSSKPGFRVLSREIENWRLMGYDEDPNKLLVSKYKDLTYDDIREFYVEHLQNKPVSIGVVGNKKDVDVKELKTLGEVDKIRIDDLFTY